MTRTQTPQSHCRDCERKWSILTDAHCANCHCQFTTPRGFDAHLRKESTSKSTTRNARATAHRDDAASSIVCEYPAAMRTANNEPLFAVNRRDDGNVYELIRR